MGFCEGCGQPALSATREGRPICPDCIEEGYGDENTDPDMATIAYLAGAKDARDKLAALQAHADALAGYGEHTSTCDIMTHSVWFDPTPCTCGWGATFRSYEAFKAGEPT